LVITLASLAAIAAATLVPQSGTAIGSHFCLICGEFGAVNGILNVLLFLPLGIGLALSGLPWKRALLGTFLLTALIEIGQFFVIPGRYSAIGDVLANTIGGALGFAIVRHAISLLRPSWRTALALSVCWSVVWLAIQAVSGYGFSPTIPRSEYYGQIARRLENLDQFRGRVISARIGDLAVPDTRFTDSRKARELLIGGAVFTATITLAAPTHAIAPIVRVVDATRREILLFAQNTDELVFAVRTGASALRLRPPVFHLGKLFPQASPTASGLNVDPLSVSAGYFAREVRVRTHGRTSYERDIPISASLGWTMFLPFQWIIEGTGAELALSAMWTACLLLPLGYWATRVARRQHGENTTRTKMAVAAAVVLLLYVGMVAVPHGFSLNVARPSDWLAALAGILVGGFCASRAYAENGFVYTEPRKRGVA
jgi:hypothetical protein